MSQSDTVKRIEEICKEFDSRVPVVGLAIARLELAKALAESEAAQQPLVVDVAEVCDCGEPFPKSGYCKFCGARERQRH